MSDEAKVVKRKKKTINKNETEEDTSTTSTPTNNGSFMSKLSGAVFKGIVLYFAVQIVFNLFAILSPKTISPNSATSNLKNSALTSAWNIGQKSSIYVYLSKESIQLKFNEKDLVVHKNEIIFGEFSEKESINIQLNITSLSEEVTADGEYPPMYVHVYYTKSGYHPDPLRNKYDPTSLVYKRLDLVGKMKRPAMKKNLLDGSTNVTESSSTSSSSSLVQYWYPEVHISLVQDASPLDYSNLPTYMIKHLTLTRDYKHYLPTVYLNEFWQLKDKRIILSDTAKSTPLPLTITVQPMGLIKFQLLTNFDQSLRANEALFGGDGETEKLKQMFIDTNPYLLAITLLVSFLHSIFDILAFKNDIQFWRKKNNFQGLSVRSVLVSAASQIVILLYLFDQETSWLILVSTTFSTAIELWKVTKVATLKISWNQGIVPKISLHFTNSYADSDTQEHDKTAMRILYWALIPLLLGYSVYSLYSDQHKGWYSWFLGTLVGFVYSFGFIMMLPQLFINYKMKSVAHMPWRVFIYKALNTFIDDLFSFIIKMPTMHRLACFRDDIVFIIYLVQRWMYPVDKTRPNEYGQVFESEDNEEESEEEELIEEKKNK